MRCLNTSERITGDPSITDDGEEFGWKILRQFLIESNGTEPNAALDRLFKQITTGNPQDDLTAVLVHFD
jgi:hypothetical protein